METADDDSIAPRASGDRRRDCRGGIGSLDLDQQINVDMLRPIKQIAEDHDAVPARSNLCGGHFGDETAGDRQIVNDHQNVVARRLNVALDRVRAVDEGGVEGGPTVVGMALAAATMGDDLRTSHDDVSAGASPRTVARATSRIGTVESMR